MRLKNVFSKNSGSAVFDWLVLCAGLVAMASAFVLAAETGTLVLSGDMDGHYQSGAQY